MINIEMFIRDRGKSSYHNNINTVYNNKSIRGNKECPQNMMTHLAKYE